MNDDKQTAKIEVPVKFKLGQTVWYNHIPKPKTMTVRSLRILCTYNGYTGECWGDDTGSGRGWPFRVQYSEEQSPKEDQWTSQELLFASKEELLQSI